MSLSATTSHVCYRLKSLPFCRNKEVFFSDRKLLLGAVGVRHSQGVGYFLGRWIIRTEPTVSCRSLRTWARKVVSLFWLCPPTGSCECISLQNTPLAPSGICVQQSQRQ